MNGNQFPASGQSRWHRGVIIGAALLVLGASFLVFARGIQRPLNHDEHQFLSPGAVLARHGALPYRDYPLFHLPNLVFVYAAVERLGIDLVLGAKLISILATCSIIGMLVREAVRRPAFGHPAGGLFVAVGGVALLIFDPLFSTATGKTWNHEVPTALVFAALLLIGRAGERNSLFASVLAGLMAGLAVGFRLTFAPVLVPLALAAFLYPVPLRRQLAHGIAFGLCATVALAPSLYFLCTDREAFLFGNFEFPRLRLRDPANERIQKTVTWWRKLRYFAKEIVVPSWPLFLAFFTVAVAPAWAWLRRREGGQLASGVLLLTLPFFLLGCFAPSRYQYQHFYVLIPFLALGIVYGLQCEASSKPKVRLFGSLISVAAIVSILLGINNYRNISPAWNKDEWATTRTRSVGGDIRKHIAHGKILTLAPTYPLLGGFDIYPEFATGPFAWRSAHLVPAERRRRLHLVAPDDLDMFLASDPPAAILTGYEDDGDLEKPLVDYARRHGYRFVRVSKRRDLWIAQNAPN